MAQLEPLKDRLKQAGASLVYLAAQKRGGMFDPEKYLIEHPVPFPFLLDEDRSVTKLYGVYHGIGLDAFNIAHPATFVIGRDGVIRYIHVGASQVDRAPIDELMRAAEKR
jgi:peroxiredoxin